MQTDSRHRETNRRHALIMLLCSLLPVAATAAIWVLGVSLDSVLLFAMLLLCPLGLLLMMRNWRHHEEGSGHPMAISGARQKISIQDKGGR